MKLELLNPLRWRKSFIIALLAAFLAVWFLFFDTYSLWTRYELANRKQTLLENTQKIKEQTKDLETKIQQLETNKALIEKIAREKYGMQKPGETVYIIKESR